MISASKHFNIYTHIQPNNIKCELNVHKALLLSILINQKVTSETKTENDIKFNKNFKYGVTSYFAK